jgi:hypothetical protein
MTKKTLGNSLKCDNMGFYTKSRVFTQNDVFTQSHTIPNIYIAIFNLILIPIMQVVVVLQIISILFGLELGIAEHLKAKRKKVD